MDGKGRWLDNVFVERLWRSLKYEDIYLKGYADGREAKAGIASWMTFYNLQRPHQALGNRTPMAAWREGTTGALGGQAVDDACPADKLGQRCRVAHISTASTTAAGFCSITVQEKRTVELPTTKPHPVVLTDGSTRPR